MSAPLFIEHFLDASAYGINHVEVYHCPTQTFIAEMCLRLFVPQNILQRARIESSFLINPHLLRNV